ncbi:MAG: hypothetical protein WBM83_09810 [Flavobacteriaceae bacterium]
MKKFIVVIAIGLSIIFVLDLVFGKILEHFYFTQSSGLQYQTTYAMQETEADVLVFGSSRACHQYDPRILEDSLNMTVYNVGREAQFMLYQTALLRAVLKRHTPKFIILDFPDTFYTSEYDYDRLSLLYPYYKKHPEIRNIIDLKSPFEKVKMLSWTYPYNSIITTIAVGNLEFNKTREVNINYAGYLPLHGIFDKPLDSVPAPQTYEFDQNKIDLFKEFIRLTKEKNIPLVVTYSPIYYLYDKDPSMELCRQICIENEIPLLNFTRDTEFLDQRDYFDDATHLNDSGVTIFTKKLAALLKQKGLPKVTTSGTE